MKDTFNLLGDGIVQLGRALAKQRGMTVEAWAEEAGCTCYVSASSLKGQADIAWDRPAERKRFLRQIVADADRVLEQARVTRERLEAILWRLAKDLLRAGLNVILESGFWLRADRDQKRIEGHALGAFVELYFLDVPLDELIARVERRGIAGGDGVTSLTADEMRGWSTIFQAPDEDELGLFDRAVVRH